MNEKKRLIKNTALIAIGGLGAKVVSFLLLPLYTSILSTSEYGTYDFIITIGVFLLPVVTLVMHEAMFRFIIDLNKESKEFKKIISNAFFSVLAGIFLTVIVFAALYILLYRKDSILLIYILGYVVTSSLYTFSNYLLRGLGEMKTYAAISCFKNILQLVLNVVAVAVLRLGVKGLVLSLCISEFIGFLVILFTSKLWRYMDFRLVSRKELKPMIKYSLPLIPNSLSSQVIHLSDRLIIMGIMNSSANGIYTVSYKFPNMIETLYHYFYTAWSESASRVFAKGKEKALEYYQSLYNTLNRFIFSVVLTLIAGMPILFRIFIKGKFIDGFKYVPILVLSMYFDCMARFYSGIFTALKKTKVMATTTIIAAVLNLGINIALIKYVGLYAAAGSTLIAEAVLCILRQKRLKEYMDLKVSKIHIALMITTTAIVVLLYDYNSVIKIACSLTFAIVFSFIYNFDTIKKMYIITLNKLKKKKLSEN